jgi:ribosomal protein S18
MMRPVPLSLITFRLSHRPISTTSVNFIKQIQEKRDGNTTYVSGVSVESERKKQLAVPPADARSDACPLCKLGLRRLSYSDVLILNQFIAPDGNLMTLRDSKLCSRQYSLVKKLVEMAQKCKLLPRPAGYEVYGPWDSLNTYHDWPPRRRDVAMKVVQPYYWKNIDHNKY